MKRIALTIAALAVSAAMIFAFAGCQKVPEGKDEAATGNAVVTEADASQAAN